MINNQQNEWTKRQLFNTDTFVLRSADGYNLTVNSIPNLGVDTTIYLPEGGGGAGNPAPPDRSVQFNDGGVFGGFGSWVLAADGEPSTLTVPGWASVDGLKFNNAIYNVIIGTRALEANVFGPDNIAIGYVALANNYDGTANVAIGSLALQANQKGTNNIAVGYNALGSNDISGNGLGRFNIGIGSNALILNVDGQDNVAVGINALSTNTNGSGNVAIGTEALGFTEVGPNTGVGYVALGSTTTGIDNTAIGHSSFVNNETGSDNVGLGTVGFEKTKTVLNERSIQDTKMVFVGNYATRGGRPPTTPMTNGIAVGYGATVLNDNTAVVGNANLTDVYLGSANANAFVHSKALVMRANDGKVVTVKAREGRPADETVTLPVAGTIVANALFGSNTNQTISTAPVTVAFQTDSPTNNNINRVGNEFTLVNAGYYNILIEIHIEQGAPNNVLKCWAEAEIGRAHV